MGLEARCIAKSGREKAEGKALLATDELIFRGDLKLRIPFASIESVAAERGDLRVRWSGGEASFSLGDAAAKWAERILHPRSLIDKLGVKEGHRVSVLGLDDAAFLRDLRARAPEVAVGRALAGSDIIFIALERRAALSRLSTLRRSMAPDGAIWALWRRGSDANEDSVRNAARGMDLVDVKIARFSDTYGAIKLVVPLAKRPKPAKAGTPAKSSTAPRAAKRASASRLPKRKPQR
jgi:hypothetical protein